MISMGKGWINKTKPLGIALVSLMLMSMICFSAASVAGEDEEAWEEVEEQREEIERLENRIVELESSVRQSEQRFQELEVELEEKEAKVEEAEKDLEKAQERLDEKREVFGERLRSVYMEGNLSLLELLVQAESFGDLIFWTKYIFNIFEQDSQLVEDLRDSRDEYQTVKQELEEERQEVASLYEEEKQERDNFRQTRQQKEELLYEAEDKLKRRLAEISTRAEAPPAYGVIIDNDSRARPQQGFAQAQRVYEFEIEYSTTRYLALYSEFPDEVGPIRSVRRHSILLSIENNIHLVHSGGSPDNVQRMARKGLSNTDARGHEDFWRSPHRRAPHNLYGDLTELDKRVPPNRSDVRPVYPRQDVGEDAEQFSFHLACGRRVSYHYNSTEEIYYRYLDGSMHRDAGDNPITARNVIIQYVNYYIDDRGRPTASVIGEGDMVFYSNGQRFEGTWKRESQNSETRYFYEDGEEIEIPYGATWIQLQRG